MSNVIEYRQRQPSILFLINEAYFVNNHYLKQALLL